MPWDRSQPNLALEDMLTDQAKLLGVLLSDKVRSHCRQALVLGCSKSYDVLLLASFRYNTYRLEVSPTAVEQCRSLHKSTLAGICHATLSVALVEQSSLLGISSKTVGSVRPMAHQGST